MKEYDPEHIRNVAVVGHGGCGKTSLVEAMLFDGKATTRMGEIEKGTTVADFEPEEVKRKISISAALAPVEWRDTRINLIDTPGYADFVGEVVGALRAVDSILMVVDASAGVEVQTEKIWKYAQKDALNGLVFVNRMERENANFTQALASVQQRLTKQASPLTIPLGEQAAFKGIIDLIKMKAIVGSGGQAKEEDIPDNARAEADKYREKLIELIVEVDDKLLEKYLEGEDIAPQDLARALRLSVQSGHLTPVLCGSGTHDIGVAALLDAIRDILPSAADRLAIKGANPKTKEEVEVKCAPDAPLAALVFKTISDPYVGKLTFARVFSGTLKADSPAFNASRGKKERIGHLLSVRGKHQEDVKLAPAGDIVAIPKLEEAGTGDTLSAEANPIVFPPIKFPEPVFSMAIEPKTRGDEERLSASLTKLTDEDKTISVKRDPEMRQTVVSGLGDLHVEVMTDRLKRKFGVESVLVPPSVPYRETILTSAKGQGKYKKQTGGHGQYGDVWLELQPLPRGEGFQFEDKIFGGAIPKNYLPAVEKGVKESMQEGVVAGYPVVDVKVRVYDGSFHPVDSSDMAFKIAAGMAMKKCAQAAKPVLLEPVMNVEVTVPEKFAGDIMGDLNSKRGRVLGMEPYDNQQLVRAQVPLAEMGRYATELRSITRGQGSYKMEFHSYEQVPPNVAEKITQERAEAKEKH